MPDQSATTEEVRGQDEAASTAAVLLRQMAKLAANSEFMDRDEAQVMLAFAEALKAVSLILEGSPWEIHWRSAKDADHDDTEFACSTEDGFTTKGDLITGSIPAPAVDTEAVRAIAREVVAEMFQQGLKAMATKRTTPPGAI